MSSPIRLESDSQSSWAATQPYSPEPSASPSLTVESQETFRRISSSVVCVPETPSLTGSIITPMHTASLVPEAVNGTKQRNRNLYALNGPEQVVPKMRHFNTYSGTSSHLENEN